MINDSLLILKDTYSLIQKIETNYCELIESVKTNKNTENLNDILYECIKQAKSKIDDVIVIIENFINNTSSTTTIKLVNSKSSNKSKNSEKKRQFSINSSNQTVINPKKSQVLNFISKTAKNSYQQKCKYNILDDIRNIQDNQIKSSFTYMSLNSQKNGFYCYDAGTHTLKKYDQTGNVLQPLSLFQINFKKFGPFSVNFENDICFTDNHEEIIVLTCDQKILKKIKINSFISDIIFDDQKSDIIYYSDTDNDSIHVWNLNLKYSNEPSYELRRLSVIRPLNIYPYENKLLITSLPEVYYKDVQQREIKEIKNGNCIFIMSKNNLNNYKIIKFIDWFQPSGLYVDDNEHIYTVAFKLDFTKSISIPCLFILDFNGNRLKEFRFDKLYNFNKVLMFEGKIVFSGGDKFRGFKIASLRKSYKINSDDDKNSVISLSDHLSIQSNSSSISRYSSLSSTSKKSS